MEDGKYTIHKSKKSQVDKLLTASDRLRKSLESATSRVTTVTEINRVSYVDDARAADLLATRDSFKYISQPMVWIAGTTSHERDYALVQKYVELKVRSIIVYGSRGDDMRNKLEKLVDHFHACPTLAEAIKTAKTIAVPGDAVLYSPSCKAQDTYANFVERSAAFKLTVKELSE